MTMQTIRSQYFKDQKLANEYFDVLTTKLKLGKGVPKVITGVEEKVEEAYEVSLV